MPSHIRLGIALSILFALSVAGYVGCTPSASQQAAVLRDAGLTTAALWIGTDNPTPAQCLEVEHVIAFVNEYGATNVTLAPCYSNLMAVGIGYITNSVPSVDRPLVMAGIANVLSAMDAVFQLHSEWTVDDSNTLVSDIRAYLSGVGSGLLLPDGNYILTAARQQYAVRHK